MRNLLTTPATLFLTALAGVPLAFWLPLMLPYEPAKLLALYLLTGIASVVGLAWILRAPCDRYELLASRATTLDLAILVYLTTLSIGTVASIEPALSFQGSWERGTGLVYYLVLTAMFLVVRFSSSERAWHRFAQVSTVVALIVSGYALAQRFGFDHPGLRGTFLLYGLSGPTRVFSTFGHPNYLGTYLAMTLPFLLLAAHDARTRTWCVISITSAVAACIAIALTYSRASWLAALMAVMAFFWLRAPRPSSWYRKTAISLAALGLMGASLLVVLRPFMLRSENSFVYKIAEATDPRRGSFLARVNEWEYSIDLLLQRPLVGYGIGTYIEYSAARTKDPNERNRDFLEADPSIADRLHNGLFDAAWSGGLLALGALAFLWYAAIRRMRETFTVGTQKARGLAAALSASLAAYAVAGMFGFDFSVSGMMAYLALAGLSSLLPEA